MSHILGQYLRPTLKRVALYFLCTASHTALALNLVPENLKVPAATQAPEGMQVIASEADYFSADYLPNVEYARVGDRALKLNILMPNKQPGLEYQTDQLTAPRPLIVYVQGSAWFAQNMNRAIAQLAEFAHRGYVVASVEYRHSLEAKAPAQLIDVKTAIRFLRANASTYHIDPDRIGIWGDSSGGHMASLVGVTAGLKQFEQGDNLSQPSTVRAVVNFYGPTDFIAMSNYPSAFDHNAPDSPESTVVGGPITAPENKAKVTQYNPISYIGKQALPPFLIMHGDKDPLVPFNQSVLLYEKLKAAGQPVTFYKIQGAGHGTRFWTPGVLKIVADFFDEHL